MEPSYVLRAIGADEDLAHSSIRFGIGRFTTEEEVDYTADKCIKVVDKLREMRYVGNCNVRDASSNRNDQKTWLQVSSTWTWKV